MTNTTQWCPSFQLHNRTQHEIERPFRRVLH